MKRLLLLRHAKSDWSGGEADIDRPINARGQAAAARMGQELADVPIDLILCSPAVRTQQTLALLDVAAPVRFEPRIYEAATGQLIELIAETAIDIKTLLLIGHMPGIAGVAIRLASGDMGKDYLRLGEGYPTAALAELALDIDHWREIGPGCARVERFVRPRELD